MNHENSSEKFLHLANRCKEMFVKTAPLCECSSHFYILKKSRDFYSLSQYHITPSRNPHTKTRIIFNHMRKFIYIKLYDSEFVNDINRYNSYI